MDGKGCWRDNVFVERLWRSVKYEEVYLHAYASVPEARVGIGRYFEFTTAFVRTRALAAERPTRYTSTSRFSQRHDHWPAIHLTSPRDCPNKPSQLCRGRRQIRSGCEHVRCHVCTEATRRR
jgi:hypothetical protein